MIPEVETHPSLEAVFLEVEFATPLGETPSPPWLVDLLRPDAPSPLARNETLRAAIRDLLRHGGYKPTGRGKPASEYLARAAEEGGLRSINAVVDVCNAVSLHGGIPISVVDADLARPPLHVGLGAAGARYGFNATGQEIDVEGLLCLHDADGPCANAVKDAQRTKTNDATRRTLWVFWGTKAAAGAALASSKWATELLEKLGARVASM